MLIGQSGVCELLPRNRRNDENWINKKLCFSHILYNVLHLTSRTTERRCSQNQSLFSWVVVTQPLPYAQKSRPDAVMTRQEQQEATTHCRSEFEIRYFDYNERSYSINL